MKARTLSIVAAALIAASTGAQALYPIPTSGGYLHAAEFQALAQAAGRFPAPGEMNLGAAALPAVPGELSGRAAVEAHNSIVALHRQVVQLAIDSYRMCMEMTVDLARKGQAAPTTCTVPTVPALAPMGWREDDEPAVVPQGGRK